MKKPNRYKRPDRPVLSMGQALADIINVAAKHRRREVAAAVKDGMNKAWGKQHDRKDADQ